MLVMTRRKDEKIIIGDEIEVTIVEILDNKQVRLGFEAPVEIEIIREELFNRIQEENKIASQKYDINKLNKLKEFKGFMNNKELHE